MQVLASEEPGAIKLPRRPLFHDDSEIGELADHSFEIAADAGAVFRSGRRGFDNRDHAAVMPSPGGNGSNGLVEVGKPQIQFLASRSRGPKQRSLAGRHGVRVRQHDAQREQICADREKRIGPLGGIVNIDIEAFGRKGNLFERGAFLVMFGGRCLGLVLSLRGIVRDALDGLLLLVTGGDREGQKTGHGQNWFAAGTMNHKFKDSRVNACRSVP